MKNFKPIVNVNGTNYLRIPIKTKIITDKDDIINLVDTYVIPNIKNEDIVCISESPLAITQGRAIPVEDIRIGFLARILWRFVAKVPYGIGLRSPESMQCAIEETGSFRIILAAVIGGFGKLLRRKGWFYIIAGKQAALIDAADTSPIPPYNKTVIKGPKNPEIIAQKIKDTLGIDSAIMDINDIGGSWMIGGSDGVDKKTIEQIMKDNPQGQADELTPFCIVRKCK
ncbi:MAG: coenzyme F420-0:L-glutamate ligase [Candidatus Cloacimonetes bacterium]|nr:coenzyme F420-0:L-glutamate ligase [Candidatus Cloacimonadota bacterium]